MKCLIPDQTVYLKVHSVSNDEIPRFKSCTPFK